MTAKQLQELYNLLGVSNQNDAYWEIWRMQKVIAKVEKFAGKEKV